MATTNIHPFPVPDETIARDFLATSIREHIHIAVIPIDDGPKPYGRWFGDDADGAAQWAVAENQKGHGVYWTVNITRRGLHKKPEKDDIQGARFLHVDIDPPFDREEILEALDSNSVAPSFVIDSGSGLQAFWRSEYIAENWPSIELVNQSLEDVFGGDHCWNIDRLMRLPGTVNYPNKLKRSKGRIPALATVAIADAGESVDPEFMRRLLPRPKPRGDKERSTVKLDGVKAISIADLGITTLNRLHEMIMDPRNPDRSSDEEIGGILLNADLPISGHCLDQGSPLRAVRRAIGSARAVTANEEPQAREEAAENPTATEKAAKPIVSATPFVWRPLADIPLRPWVYGRWLLRGTVTAVVAPGGVGKSSLMAATALSLATGRALLGKQVWDGPKRVWLWNLEDDGDELSRQIQAAAKHHDISEEDCGDRLFVDSAMEGAELCTAVEVDHQLRIMRPVIDGLVEELISRKIDVLEVDPFVSSHGVPENDNSMIDAVVKEWARVAKRANCSIILVHHTRKTGGQKITAELARGAVALIAAARSALVLNRMEPEEAERLGIEGDDERRRYFNVGDDKHNRAPAEKAQWYRLASVDLGNGPANSTDSGDSVGVVEPWVVPDPFKGLTGDHLLRVQMSIAEGEWREDWQSPEWVGTAVADVLGLDPKAKADRARMRKLIGTWIDNGALAIVSKTDPKTRKARKFVEVGQWQNDNAPPKNGGASHGGAVMPKKCATTTPAPMGVVGGAGGDGQRKSVAQSHGDALPDDWHENPALGRKRGPILAPGESLDDPVPGWN